MDRNTQLWTVRASISFGLLAGYFLFAFHDRFGAFGRTRFLLAIVLFVSIAFGSFLSWILSRKWLRETSAKKLTVLSLSALLSILMLDVLSGVYLNLQKISYNYDDRLLDPHLWVGEVFPSVYQPTEKNFELYKPNQIISGETYGGLYDPVMLQSASLVKKVLEKRYIHYFIDENGFRETTPLEQARIFVLGDSFAEGFGIDQGDSWSELLEKSSGKPIYNLGCSRHSPKQEIMILEYMLEKKKASMKIEHILWMIFEGNDLEDSYGDTKKRGLRENFRGTILYPLALLPEFLSDSSFLNKIATGKIRISSSKGGYDPYRFNGIRLKSPLYHSQKFGYRLFEALHVQRASEPLSYFSKHPNRSALEESFARMTELSRKHGFQLTVLIAPSDVRVCAPYFKNFAAISKEPHFINYLQDLCKKFHIPVVNLYTLLEPYARNEMLYFRDDSHWNRRGQQVVAQIVAQNVSFL